MSTTTAADIEGVLSRRVAKCRPRWPDLYQLEIELTYCGDVERAEEVYDATLEYSGTDEEVLGEWATAARGDFEDLDMRLIAFVHARCLYWHIAQVLHARSPERRAEHLEWFVLPPRFDGVERDLSRVDPMRIPFSFELCCWFEQWEPDEVRRHLLRTLNQLQGKPLRRRPHAGSNAGNDNDDGVCATVESCGQPVAVE
jgi:hypothetical protein